MVKEKKSVVQQVTEAMDGRSQRWVCLRAMIIESEFSRKMNGKTEFTQEEIDRINTVLKSNIKLS